MIERSCRLSAKASNFPAFARCIIACLAFSFAFPAFSQQTKLQPDCTLGAVFAGTGNSSNYDNRSVSANSGVPCTLWALTWSAQTAVTSLTINIEGAPDSAGAPGTFASLASGSTFPSGKVTYSASTAYSPWIRITVSAAGSGGQINATLNGWREDQASIGGGGGGGSGCPGTTGTPCVVVGPTATGAAPTDSPVQIAELDHAGNIITPVVGNKANAIALSAVSGENQIIALSGTTVIRLTHLSVGMSVAATVSIDVGTGTNCGTGTATIWGPYPSNTTGFSLDFDESPLTVPAGDAVCLNFGATVTAGGGAAYAQY